MPERLDLNAVTATELREITGLDDEMANRIVDYRGEHGGFESIDDLRAIDGVPSDAIERLRQHVIVGKTDGEAIA